LKEYKEQLFKKKAKSMVNFEKGGGYLGEGIHGEL
jgi:hypothetical protein